MAELNHLLEEDSELERDDAIIGHAILLTLGILLLIAIGVAGVWWMSRTPDVAPPQQQEVSLPSLRQAPEFSLPDLKFTNITPQAGIGFQHVNGAMGEKLLPETMGGGCAFFDYDGDGSQDLLLINSTNWAWNDADSPPATPALYINDGKGHFENQTEATGLNIELYGMGVAVGDYDNDDDPDLFISAVGKNYLLRNDDGHYVDVTDTAHVAGKPDEWSTSCGWLDYDNDGDLDLVVANYVKWSRDIDIAQDFRIAGIGRAYGPPFSFQGTYPYLYRNEGDGTFTEVAAHAGLHVTNSDTGVPLAKTLGVTALDANRDGWIDIVLANDTVRNLLFINQRDGTFVERGVESGIAFDSSGKARGAMGIDVAHFRNDDTIGIAIANFANEMTGFYVARGQSPLFTDEAIPTGLGPPTRQDLAFGLFFADFDLDGRLDLFCSNGHIEDEISRVQTNQRYRQPPKIFLNAGMKGSSEFVCYHPGEDSGLNTPIAGRGAAYADIDGDGDLDLVATQIAGPPLLLRNDQGTNNNFLRLSLKGSSCNHDAIGAVVVVKTADGLIRRQVMPTRSYLSQMELPVTIGLGPSQKVESILVEWPNGKKQDVTDFEVNATTVVREN